LIELVWNWTNEVQAQAIPDFERIACEQIEALLSVQSSAGSQSKPDGSLLGSSPKKFASLIVFEIR